MPQFEKHFTREEAQGLIPWVQSTFEKIHRTLRAVIDHAASGDPPHSGIKVNAGNGRNGHVNGNGHAKVAKPGAPPDFDHLMTSLDPSEKKGLIEALIGAILERGIVIQDVGRGLIDFPAMRDGREVLICYELADGETIRFWHDVDAGYAGRRDLDE